MQCADLSSTMADWSSPAGTSEFGGGVSTASGKAIVEEVSEIQMNNSELSGRGSARVRVGAVGEGSVGKPGMTASGYIVSLALGGRPMLPLIEAIKDSIKFGVFTDAQLILVAVCHVQS